MNISDYECAVNGCARDAAEVVSPEGEHHAVLLCSTCYRDGGNGLCSLSVGRRVLMCTEWEGWFYLPDADERLQALGREVT